MNFIPEYQTAKLDSVLQLGTLQVTVDASMIPKSDELVDRVLSITCDSVVFASEVFAGEARFGGSVKYRVLYVDSNGVNQCLSHSVDFSDKIVHNSITQATKPIFTSMPLDTVVLGSSNHEIRLSTTVQVRLDAVMRQDINCLILGGEGIYTNNSQVQYNTCVHEVLDSVTVVDSIPDTNARRVLCVQSNAQIKSCTTSNDVVVCTGNIVATVFYEIDNNVLKSLVYTIPWVQEVSVLGIDSSNNAIATVDIKSTKVNDIDDSGQIAIDTVLTLHVLVFANVTFSPVVDVFSVHNELNIRRQECKVQRVSRQIYAEERIDGNVTLDDTLADTITGVNNAKVTTTTVRCSNGSVVLEGILTCNILYYNADLNTTNNISPEIPFSISMSQDISECDNILVLGTVSNITTKIRRGTEIDVRADVGFLLTIVQAQNISIITELELGAKRALPTAAFSIHIARSQESLWDVARVLGVAPDTILQQNPNLLMPLIGGERVVAYRQLSNISK
ncbi:MAG: DUF3794 domain-containing protein [Clostridiales bacterium]|jgi:hypothetical protein|nr:DUF3794 domain-containing protein [Clostridiales bacterium]